jgi:hypothetical protein
MRLLWKHPHTSLSKEFDRGSELEVDQSFDRFPLAFSLGLVAQIDSTARPWIAFFADKYSEVRGLAGSPEIGIY